MAAKHKLINSMKLLLEKNKHGSFATQNKRAIELAHMAKDLTKGGYKMKHVQGLKPKHVEYLNKLWQERGLSAGTIKNKNAQLRWWADITGKSNIIPSNEEMGLEKRIYVSGENKSLELADIDMEKIKSQHMQAYLRLQYHLGLRREEALKLKPHLADKGHALILQGSWCKGGRPRIVPILTKEARDVVDFAKSLALSSELSLIPEEKSYKEQKIFYDNQVAEAGIHHAHGLRHAYAQRRYKELTGWECSLKGGSKYADLTPEEKVKDYEARLTITEELGHSRVSILSQYIGR